MPELAVVTSVYKNQEGLDRTLRTLPNDGIAYDLYVVDDGSHPPIRLTEARVPGKVFLIRLERNKGAAAARNRALQEIFKKNYSYVAILDAGDIALPGRFRKTVEFLQVHPDYGLVGGQAEFLDPFGRLVGFEKFPLKHDALVRAMRVRCLTHSSVTLRVATLREVGGYREDFLAAHDYELFWRIIRSGYKLATLPDVIVRCYINPKGITIRRRKLQKLNLLRVMLHNFDPLVKESYLGLVKHSLLFFVPFSWALTIKRLVSQRPDWL